MSEVIKECYGREGDIVTLHAVIKCTREERNKASKFAKMLKEEMRRARDE
jgi:hypothetical protein